VHEHSADAVIQCAKNAFSLLILQRHVGIGETHVNAMIGEEGAEGKVVKLLVIISLKCKNGEAVLGGDLRMES
jgi:hypothetical protein